MVTPMAVESMEIRREEAKVSQRVRARREARTKERANKCRGNTCKQQHV